MTQEEIEYLATTTRYSNKEVYDLIVTMKSYGLSDEGVKRMLCTCDPFAVFRLWQMNQVGGGEE